MKKTTPPNIAADIESYIIARRDRAAIDAICGTDRAKAVEMRHERFSTMRAKTEAAENLIMSVMTEHKHALNSVGIYEFYSQLSSGEHGTTIFRIADETVKAFS